MPISDVYIDWDQQIIHVPKTATQLVQSVPTEIRALDLDLFRLQLKNLEDDVDGMPFVDTHLHVTVFDLGDGTTLARAIKIINGYTITFEDGQYRVNLVGANTNISVSTNVNQVGINSANSAGLVHIEQILDQSFAGTINIDVDEGLSGVQYPRGTQTDPVDNFTDAKAISLTRKLDSFVFDGVITLDALDDIEHTHWQGHGHIVSRLVMDGNDTSGCTFRDMMVSGTMSGICFIRDCHIMGLVDFKGHAHNSIFATTTPIVLASNPSLTTLFLDCHSGVPGTGTPILDLTNLTASDTVSLRAYSGGITLKNLTSAANISIDMIAGNVIIDSSCTAGTIVVRGLSDFTDNSVGATLVTNGLVYAKELNDAILVIRSNTAATLGLI